MFDTQAEMDFLHYATEFFKTSIQINEKSSNRLDAMYNIMAKQHKKYVVIVTDGYMIDTSEFKTKEEAISFLHDDYRYHIPEEGIGEEWLSDSYCNLEMGDALLYCNGDKVYCWKTIEVDL